MLQLLIFIIILLKEIIMNWFSFSYQNIVNVFISVLSIYSKYFGWKQEKSILYSKNISNPNHILYISNHVSLVDFFHFIQYFKEVYPDYHIILVTKKVFSYIPILGNIIKQNCILLESDFQKDEESIKNSLETIKQKHKKTLVLFFPEGKVMNNDAIQRSKKWCDKQHIEQFNNVLCPHYKGLYYILKHYNPQKIYQTFLIFKDDPQNKKAKEYYHYATGNLPKHSVIYIDKANKILKYFNKHNKLERKGKTNILESHNYFQQKIYNYWRCVDYKMGHLKHHIFSH